MQVDQYVETIRRQLEVAAEAGGDEARALAERLVAPLEAAIRLAVQDALADAAEEITLELAPGSVELRLRGRDPEFVVTLPPADLSLEEDREAEDAATGDWLSRRTDAREGTDGGDDAVARINLRLPERLKARVERAAADEGLSVNTWLVRAAVSAVERSDPIRRRERRTPSGSQRYQGWAR
jgi:predicted DNA binding CopG/RHH family protein